MEQHKQEYYVKRWIICNCRNSNRTFEEMIEDFKNHRYIPVCVACNGSGYIEVLVKESEIKQ